MCVLCCSGTAVMKAGLLPHYTPLYVVCEYVCCGVCEEQNSTTLLFLWWLFMLLLGLFYFVGLTTLKKMIFSVFWLFADLVQDKKNGFFLNSNFCFFALAHEYTAAETYRAFVSYHLTADPLLPPLISNRKHGYIIYLHFHNWFFVTGKH